MLSRVQLTKNMELEKNFNQAETNNESRKKFNSRIKEYAKKIGVNPEVLLYEYALWEKESRDANPDFEKSIYENENLLAEQLIIEKIILEKENMIDGPTKIFNRKFLDKHIEKIDIDIKKRKEQKKKNKIKERKDGKSKNDYYIIMIDIDYFKRWNDSLGHQHGDIILKEVADILQKNIRIEDIVARYGGEEFTIVATGLNGDLPEFADRIRQTIADEFKNKNKITVDGQEKTLTISLGVSKWLENGNKTINAADKALYEAKEIGHRNCVYYYNNSRELVQFEQKQNGAQPAN